MFLWVKHADFTIAIAKVCIWYHNLQNNIIQEHFLDWLWWKIIKNQIQSLAKHNKTNIIWMHVKLTIVFRIYINTLDTIACLQKYCESLFQKITKSNVLSQRWVCNLCSSAFRVQNVLRDKEMKLKISAKWLSVLEKSEWVLEFVWMKQLWENW